MLALIIGIAILICITFMFYAIGVKKTCQKLRYCFSFHWVVLAAVEYRNGETATTVFNKAFTEIVENDADFVHHVMKNEVCYTKEKCSEIELKQQYNSALELDQMKFTK